MKHAAHDRISLRVELNFTLSECEDLLSDLGYRNISSSAPAQASERDMPYLGGCTTPEGDEVFVRDAMNIELKKILVELLRAQPARWERK